VTQVRTSLQTNNVLSVQDAKDKRFALMNEVLALPHSGPLIVST